MYVHCIVYTCPTHIHTVFNTHVCWDGVFQHRDPHSHRTATMSPSAAGSLMSSWPPCTVIIVFAALLGIFLTRGQIPF